MPSLRKDDPVQYRTSEGTHAARVLNVVPEQASFTLRFGGRWIKHRGRDGLETRGPLWFYDEDVQWVDGKAHVLSASHAARGRAVQSGWRRL